MSNNIKIEKEREEANKKHIEIYNKTLEGIEYILDGTLNDLWMYHDSFLELPKTAISTLDFVVSSLTKLQKGHRLALGMDDDTSPDDSEPEINIIEGVDVKRL
jgi:hypothetical protein